MNTRNKMVIVKGEVKTSEIISCKYNYESKKWEVTFKIIRNIHMHIRM